MAKRGVVILLALIGVLVVLAVGSFGVAYLAFSRGPRVPSNAMLVLEIGGDLPENAPTDLVTFVRGGNTATVRSIVDTLRKAQNDSRVAAVFLKPTGFTSPYWGKVQEIRDAVLAFRTSGKPVYAFLDYADERTYYLATAADRVFLMPSATLDLTGVATYSLFLRGTFDKIGVVPDMHHIGAYKTAVNQYTEKTYTPTHKEMDEALNRDLFEQLVHGVAEARKKTDAEVTALVDEGPFLAEDARAAGLIDEVAYEDQALEKLRQSHDEPLARLDADDYGRVTLAALGLNKGPRVAVVYASGAIVGGKGGFDPLNGDTLGSEFLVDAIRDARDDDSVRAIVLRVDSPGGSATASDAIWRELVVAKEQKPDRPIIVSMSDLAASGGYYIAMPADAIVAQPATLTGSIGIFGGKLVTGGVYEKLGAHIESTSIGKNAEMYSAVRPFSPSEGAKLDAYLRAFYGDFVNKAAQSRKTTPEAIDAVAQGRVWTGRQAKEKGLVDELGGLSRAIAVAKTRAKIDAASDVEVVAFPRQRRLVELIADSFSNRQEAALRNWMSTLLSVEERTALRALRGTTSMFRPNEPVAMMEAVYVR